MRTLKRANEEIKEDIVLSSERTSHSEEDLDGLNSLCSSIFSVNTLHIHNKRNRQMLVLINYMLGDITRMSELASDTSHNALNSYKKNCEDLKNCCDQLKGLVERYLKEDNL
jgi:hypothetical protein